ncbi:MAG: hypothetical protein CO094_07760 [Anaerolineae bacterium CG_4_9_14_3_um_filter_57_17]|nr:hypothetical protein [bacterium]NCT19846.1 hypothetical protein [bacterium]OIO84496.1 MAG: hypothetical protein AUK01_09260 [Anaerolineae bacterium CG2_30_57_67]PJB66271.1 MAG: hypothetical protein CO094_07760 [Anaerolineae bacterium CG_4_9_14_3_um_filter_57_17]
MLLFHKSFTESLSWIEVKRRESNAYELCKHTDIEAVAEKEGWHPETVRLIFGRWTKRAEKKQIRQEEELKLQAALAAFPEFITSAVVAGLNNAIRGTIRRDYDYLVFENFRLHVIQPLHLPRRIALYACTTGACFEVCSYDICDPDTDECKLACTGDSADYRQSQCDVWSG